MLPAGQGSELTHVKRSFEFPKTMASKPGGKRDGVQGLLRYLGVRPTATPDEIKHAYRKLARKYHPDVSKVADAESRFKEVGEAYEVLKDTDKRAAYGEARQTENTDEIVIGPGSGASMNSRSGPVHGRSSGHARPFPHGRQLAQKVPFAPLSTLPLGQKRCRPTQEGTLNRNPCVEECINSSRTSVAAAPILLIAERAAYGPPRRERCRFPFDPEGTLGSPRAKVG